MLKAELKTIEAFFHELITKTAGQHVSRHKSMPVLSELLDKSDKSGFFSMEDIYGGFDYSLEEENGHYTLKVRCWCRIQDNIEQIYLITKDGIA